MTVRHIPYLLVACAGLQASAQTVTQTVPFNFSNSGAVPLTIVTAGQFTGTVQPFNPTLGTLESFEITWSIDFAASATVTGDPNGSLSAGTGGSLSVAGLTYSGAGNSAGNGGALGESILLSFNVSHTQLFEVSNAGLTYNSSILAAVQGVSPFALSWSPGYGISGTGVGGVTGSAIGSVEIIYNHVPEADTYAAAGLLVAAVGGVAWRRRSRA